MIDIWQEKIFKYKVLDTNNLFHSVTPLRMQHDGRFYDITLSQSFAEYGLWQNFGTGREKKIGNSGDIGSLTKKGKPRTFRQPRPWMSPKYYASVMNLRDFYAESLGHEFVGLFASFDADQLRQQSSHYSKLNNP